MYLHTRLVCLCVCSRSFYEPCEIHTLKSVVIFSILSSRYALTRSSSTRRLDGDLLGASAARRLRAGRRSSVVGRFTAVVDVGVVVAQAELRRFDRNQRGTIGARTQLNDDIDVECALGATR
jgi:hypothetical protein